MRDAVIVSTARTPLTKAGRGSFNNTLSPTLGAFSVNALKTWLTSAAPDLWLFVLGGLFVAVTLLPYAIRMSGGLYLVAAAVLTLVALLAVRPARDA